MHADSQPASTPPSSASPAPRPAFDARRYTAWLVGPLAFVCLLAKLHKLVATPGGDVGSALAALFPDVAFILAFALVTWLALRFTQGPLRTALRMVLHLATLVLTVFIFIEHGFWLTTGTLLDPYTLGYGLQHIGPLGKVYLSEMGILVWLGFVLLLAVHWLPIRALRRASTRPPPVAVAHPALLPLVLLSLLPACTCVAALAVDISPPVEPLSENVVIEFASEAFAPDAPPDPDLARTTERPFEIALGSGPRAIPDGPPPNVIVIVIESLRARSTSPHDPSLDTTPFLASLAARGAHADVAWTVVTHTSKAIVGALCGIYPKLDVPIDEAEPKGLPPTCLARILRERGYATAFMQPATAHFERRDQLIENMHYETFLSKETIPQRDFEETSYFGWEDESLVAPAVAWAKQQADEKRPFFMTLLTLSTHHTYGTPTTFPKKARLGGEGSGEVNDYLNAVAYLDATLAKLFAGLQKAGALDRTLVILTGDHGEGFGEHGRRQHDSVIYEEGLHIPMVVLGAGITPGTRIGGLRSIVDIAPTVLEWLGTPVVAGLPGKSLLTSTGHDELYASCWLRQRCIATRKGDLKYIWHFDKQEHELFDLAKDPLERQNLVKTTPEATWGPLKASLIDWKSDNHARWASFFAQAAREFVTTLPPLPQRELDLTFSAPATGDASEARPLLRLVGLDFPDTRVVSGEPIQVTLHWEVLSPPGAWTPFTHLMGLSPGSRPRFNGDHTPVGGRYPTSSWVPGTFVSDEFRIQPNTHLPAGTYELVVGLWDPTSKVTGPAGRAIVSAPESQAHLVDKERRSHLITVDVLPAVPTGKPPGPPGGPEHGPEPETP